VPLPQPQHHQFSDLRLARPGSKEEVVVELPPIEHFVDDTRAMLADIVRQLREGVDVPHPSGVDHLRTMALTAACEESHIGGQPIEMAEFYTRHQVPARWL
jgi:hypothetical protein